MYSDHKLPTSKHISQLRQRLHDAANRYTALVQDTVAEPGPLLKGSYLTSGTRCGNPNCKCAQGELHDTGVLAVSEEGGRKSVYVRKPERPEVKRRTDRYRRFRQRRAELVKLHAEIVAVADEILESLAEPYIPTRGSKRSASKSRRKSQRSSRG